VARWIVAALVIPMMALGVFNRAVYLSHTHDDHGLHLHSLSAWDGGMLDPAHHLADHGHPEVPGHIPADGEEHGLELAVVPGTVVITPEAPKQLPPRGLDLTKTLTPVAILVIAVFALPAPPDPGLHIGSPGGHASGQMDLLARGAMDRLVRTSRALLL
jgi:hypothetical protein